MKKFLGMKCKEDEKKPVDENGNPIDPEHDNLG